MRLFNKYHVRSDADQGLVSPTGPQLKSRLIGLKRGIFAGSVGIGVAAVALASSGSAGPAKDNAANLYAARCSMCHGSTLGGGGAPRLQGAAFMSKWSAAKVDGLAAYIHATMPPGASEPLPPADAKILASFILAANVAKSASKAPLGDPVAQAARARLNQLASGLRPVIDAMLQSPPDEDWLLWRRDIGAQGFSPLRQINAANAGSLRLMWSRSLGKGTNGIAPLVHDGVMFIYGGGKISALDVTNGDTIWTHNV